MMTHLLRSLVAIYVSKLSLIKLVGLVGFTLLTPDQTIHAYNFSASDLNNITLVNPTTLDFGPDERLYVAQQDGTIFALTITRDVNGDYNVTNQETILLIQQIPNHDDDGTPNLTETTRQVTGILAVGSIDSPILYVSSSDPRIGGGGSGGDTNLDTNSGIVSRLQWTGSAWEKIDLIRGLPRSEENHSINGMQLDEANNELYLAVGGLTNGGAPSGNFTFICEYALSAAIIRIDLDAIDAIPIQGTGNDKYLYDLPTLDDPYRTGTADLNDPFGGNDGLNQAKLDPLGPIVIFSPGYRNAYDIVLSEAGRFYTWDNGGNSGWGGYPTNEGTASVNNDYDPLEPGSTVPTATDDVINNLDGFHYIGDLSSYVVGSYYGGHPCPTRANPVGAGLYTNSPTLSIFRTAQTGDPDTTLPSDWPPIDPSAANIIEGDFQNPGVDDSTLYTLDSSTNGLTEYTASNFGGELQGDLLVVSFSGHITHVDLNASGTIDGPEDVDEDFASGLTFPIDITAQDDGEVFQGTIWVANYVSSTITILEPQDFVECTGADDIFIDEDGDGFSNADELDVGTRPCNAASVPADADNDFLSDLNDPDDDNDGILDTVDRYPLDADNGLSTFIPIDYELLNGDPGFGFFGLGFTGLMHDGSTNYSELLADETNSSVELIAGGAVGLLTMNTVDPGDALGALNTQKNGFQFGINVMETTPPFIVCAKAFGPVFPLTPDGNASMGLFIGTGSQQDYVKIVVDANGGTPGMSIVTEVNDVVTSQFFAIVGAESANDLAFYFRVNPSTGTIQTRYSLDNGSILDLGDLITATGDLLTSLQGEPAVAIGVIATSRNESQSFSATWEAMTVDYEASACDGTWQLITTSTSTYTARHEAAYVAVGDKFYMVGGRGSRPLDIYDPVLDTWTTGATPPIEFHHFQAVELDGELWVAGAFVGGYPAETPVSTIYIYNPGTDMWRTGPTIPRPRGSAGAVVHDGKLYLAGGQIVGHESGHVAWLDCYDPNTTTWTQLADAPQARDHYQAQVVNNKLWLAAGRQTDRNSIEGVYGNTIADVDYYDFDTNTWGTLPVAANIPTERGGTIAVVLGEELVIIGGESDAQTAALDTVEALHSIDEVWRTLPSLNQGRHAIGAAEKDGNLYIASGAFNRGGGSEIIDSHEQYHPCLTQYTPTISADIGQLDYSTAPGATSPDEIVTITNTSTFDLSIADIFVSDPAFAIQSVSPTVLTPGQQTVISVNFSPGALVTNDIIGTLTILSNGTDAPISNITLNGVVVVGKPTVNITAPADSSTFVAGDPVNFTATAVDSDTVDIAAGGTWISSLDGQIGYGASLSTSSLTTGEHTIIFNATDSDGISGSDQIDITIEARVFIAINAGGPAYTAIDGTNYLADVHYVGGDTYSKVEPILNTDDDTIYQTERNDDDGADIDTDLDSIDYNIPLSPGSYRVVFQFTELFCKFENKRVFDIIIEGATVVTGLDIFSEAEGRYIPIERVIEVDLLDSELNIEFVSSIDKAKISAIKVLGPEATAAQLVRITNPGEGSLFPTNRTISFVASGLGPASWVSSKDGVLGTGTTFDYDALTEGAHTVTLTMVAPDGALGSDTVNLQIIKPYTFWTSSITWDTASQLKTADPDSDGIINDLERGLNLNPLVSDAHLLPYLGLQNDMGIDYVTLTYRRNLDATDLTFEVDSATKLSPSDWINEVLNGGTQEILSDDGTTQLIRFRKAMGAAEQRFLKLRVD